MMLNVTHASEERQKKLFYAHFLFKGKTCERVLLCLSVSDDFPLTQRVKQKAVDW